MVKAPRSKGCRVCVQRRVKCDQERPTCSRCRKAGRQCPGYQTMSFVDEGPTIRELYKTDDRENRHVVRTSPSSSTTSFGNSRRVNSTPFEYLNQGISGESDASPVLGNGGKCQDLERSTLVSILSPTAYQSQLLSLFISTIISENPVHFGPTFSCHSIWLTQLAGRTDISSTLLHAIRAISLSFLGRQIRDESLIQNSRLIYGKTLIKLNKSLQDPVEGLGSDTLSATVLLTFFEMLNCTEQNSWVRHAGGAARLIQVRGVERHRTDLDKALFLACRYSLVTGSYLTGEPCFLSSAPWRKLSQEIYDSSPRKCASEDAREAFFQEIVHHPGYVRDSVDYMAHGGRDHLVLQDLIRRGHMHRSNHKVVYSRYIEALREEGNGPTEVPSSVDDKVFPIVYRFHGILAAAYFCSYWSLLKLLNITLIGLEAKLSAIESAYGDFGEQATPAQMLAARNMQLSRENLTSVVVAESTTPRDVGSATLASENNVAGGGDAIRILPDRTLSRPVTDWALGTRDSECPLPAANSPTEYPTTSPSDTAKRRQMYMAENKYGAHQVCKAVEDVSNSAFLGPIFLIFSLRVVGRMLDSAEEKEWVVRKLEILGRTWGVAAEGVREAAVESNSPINHFGVSRRERDSFGSVE